jgi:TPR repeat protein
MNGENVQFLNSRLDDIQDIEKFAEETQDSGDGKIDNLRGLLCNIGIRSKDKLKSIKYYEMAVEKGNQAAMINLGLLYSREGRYKDIQKSIKYYEMAIAVKNTNAMNNLGDLYYKEEKCKDILKAIMYYKMAIDENDAMGMINLAELYYENEEHKNVLEAIKLFSKAERMENVVMTHGTIHVGRVLLGNAFAQGPPLARHGLLQIMSNGNDIVKYTTQLCEELEIKTKCLEEMKRENDNIKRENEELKTEIKYSPDGEGYEEAKEEYEALSKMK